MMKYNLKIVFGNRFVYFMGASILFYLLVTSINFFNTEDVTTVDDVYYLLFFPALLLIFFPTVYGIQNDEDARILEILFGVPNYRYKVWLWRISMTFVMVFGFLVLMAAVSGLLLVNVPVFTMALRLMVPVTFFGMLGFYFSTSVRNGNGAGVVLVVVGLILWILSEFLENTSNAAWNVFLNPFDMPSNMNETVWETVVLKNQRIQLIAAFIFLLWGLLNLQKREKFIR